MNAGAYGDEFKDIVVSSVYLDQNLTLHEIKNTDHKFNYRYSRFIKNKNDIIISTTLQLHNENKEKIKSRMDQNKKAREEKQPIEFPSAGSTFKRGKEFITAQLIDKSGLKGYSIGDAYVSQKHAGFIINKGKATAKDVLMLIDTIKRKVYDKFNVNIELEIEVIGED